MVYGSEGKTNVRFRLGDFQRWFYTMRSFAGVVFPFGVRLL